MTTSRLVRRTAVAACAATLLAPGAAAAQQHAHARGAAAAIAIPQSMRTEHRAIHEELERATTEAGRVGAAARALAAVLHPHFVREEQIALPPLGLLATLARGERDAQAAAVLPMTDSLRAELPRMLEEHEAIGAATRSLLLAARAAGNARVMRLAESLALHARTEEEVFYPAALLVGELVRTRAASPAPCPCTGRAP